MFWNRHPVRDEELSAYLDSPVASGDRARIGAHIAGCAACRETLAELRGLRAALRALPRAMAPRSFAVREAGARPRAAAGGWLLRAQPALAGLTAAAVLAFGFFLSVDLLATTNDSATKRLEVPASSDSAGVNEYQEIGPPNDRSTGQTLPGAGVPVETAPALDGAITPEMGFESAAAVPTRPPPLATGPGDTVAQPAGTADDDRTALHVAEAAAAGVALVAGGAASFVWWRRRTP